MTAAESKRLKVNDRVMWGNDPADLATVDKEGK